MMKLIHGHDRAKHPQLIAKMYELRAKVFDGRLGWDVEIRNGMETDRYDELDPLYALNVSESGDILGTFRLLHTTGPHMLADVFRELMPDQMIVRSPLIWESTRFCVDHDLAKARGDNGLSEVTATLLSSLLEIGLYAGLTHIMTVIDVRMERILRRAGCPIDRLADPKKIGDVPSLAILMECTQETVARVQSVNQLRGPCVRESEIAGLPLAA